MRGKTIWLPQYRKSKWGTNYKTHRRYVSVYESKTRRLLFCKRKKKKTTLKLILYLRKDSFDMHKDYIISYCKYNLKKKKNSNSYDECKLNPL